MTVRMVRATSAGRNSGLGFPSIQKLACGWSGVGDWKITWKLLNDLRRFPEIGPKKYHVVYIGFSPVMEAAI